MFLLFYCNRVKTLSALEYGLVPVPFEMSPLSWIVGLPINHSNSYELSKQLFLQYCHKMWLSLRQNYLRLVDTAGWFSSTSLRELVEMKSKAHHVSWRCFEVWSCLVAIFLWVHAESKVHRLWQCQSEKFSRPSMVGFAKCSHYNAPVVPIQAKLRDCLTSSFQALCLKHYLTDASFPLKRCFSQVMSLMVVKARADGFSVHNVRRISAGVICRTPSYYDHTIWNSSSLLLCCSVCSA